MKLTKPGPRRQKILLYYTLAVVLPGIVLGYLAYRGIRNDQALREKESLKRLEMNSRTLFSAIDSSLVYFVNGMTSGSFMSGTRKNDPYILALFTEDPGGDMNLLAHKLLYLPSELLTSKSDYENLTSGLKEGQHLEFIEYRFPEALKFYQARLLKTENIRGKIQILTASARLYNKMNQPENAKKVYEQIMTNYKGNLLNGQIPVALLASLEILKITRN